MGRDCKNATIPYELNNRCDPREAIQSWIELTPPDGEIIIRALNGGGGESIPDAAQALFQWIFTLHQPPVSNPNPRIVNLIDILRSLSHEVIINSIKEVSGPTRLGIEKTSKGHGCRPRRGVEIVLRRRLKPIPQACAPNRADLIARALRLYAAKEYEAVLDLLDRYSWIATQSADILNAAGASAFALKCPDWAIALYRRATEVMPSHYDAWNNLGVALFDVGQIDAAEMAYRKAVELRPQEASFKGGLVQALIRRGQLDEAQAICKTQIQENPEEIFFLGELGAIYTRQARFSEARELYRRILALRPNVESITLNCAVRLHQAGYIKEAEGVYLQAINKHQSETARFHLSLILLARGDFKRGWEAYEARAAVRKHPLPDYPFPRWVGESIIGKSLLISYEQGYGDEVMMSRYVTELRGLGVMRVGLVCRRPLVALLQTIEGVEILTPESGEVFSLKDGEFDFWTLPFDIPRFMGANIHSIPAKVPYLMSLPERRERWGKIIHKGVSAALDKSEQRVFKVGLVWKGSALHLADSERSLDGLSQLRPLWDVPNVRFYSLQKGQGEEEAKAPPENQPLIDLGTSMHDFADLAAIIDQLDLVIAVDTAVVHVAGALNKSCWVLIPHFATDWRWMLGRVDSLWYPSLRLFRQDASGSWAKVIHEAQRALIALVNKSKNSSAL